MIEAVLIKTPTLFDIDLNKQSQSLCGEIDDTKIEMNAIIQGVSIIRPALNSIGAQALKSEISYNKEDAEVWVFVAGNATELL